MEDQHGPYITREAPTGWCNCDAQHHKGDTMSLTTEKWTVQRVMHELSREQAIELWTTLPAPEPDEMNGEYTGHVHDGGDDAVRQAKHKFFFASKVGFWLGKAYRTGADGKGEGYNCFRQPDGTVNRFRRFALELGPSALDGRPALIMYYRAFNNMAGDMDLIDDIRRLDDGAYLCIYTGTKDVPGFATLKPGARRTEPELFALTGPTGAWVGVDDADLEIRRVT